MEAVSGNTKVSVLGKPIREVLFPDVTIPGDETTAALEAAAQPDLQVQHALARAVQRSLAGAPVTLLSRIVLLPMRRDSTRLSSNLCPKKQVKRKKRVRLREC